MPAREMFFTFNKDVKVNKETVAQFVEDYRYYIEENFKDIKNEFEVDGINTDFLKKFITELKGFNSVSVERGEVHGRQKIVKDFIGDIMGNEERTAIEVLGIRYLYDEWEYEGCGSEDHYYYTYTDDKKMIKKTIKETERQVEKLRNLGVKVEFSIEN